MARVRLDGTQLSSWEDVNHALRRIGEIERELMLLEASQQERIDAIKAETAATAKPIQDERTALELAMKEWCDSNRADFARLKTREMTFGSVGYRISTRLVIRRPAETLQLLKDFGLHACIRVKEDVDKTAMANLTDEQLAEVGASRKTDNSFGYELNRDALQAAA